MWAPPRPPEAEPLPLRFRGRFFEVKDMDLDALKRELTRDEGLRLRMYRDTEGIETIGYGHNLRDKPIRKEAADLIFQHDIEDATHDLDMHLPFWRTLDPVRQLVLADLSYNMGIGNDAHGLLSFKHTLAMIEAGNYVAAADGLAASHWHEQVGIRAAWLEKAMRTGVMP